MLPNYNKAYFFKIDTTIKKIRNFMQRGLSDAKIDLTVDQWVVIDHLVQSPDISQIKLGKITYKDPPTITRILDLLEKKKLIVRHHYEADRRVMTVSATQLGAKMHADAAKIITNVRKQAWTDLNEQDYDDLVRIMDGIYKNVE